MCVSMRMCVGCGGVRDGKGDVGVRGVKGQPLPELLLYAGLAFMGRGLSVRVRVGVRVTSVCVYMCVCVGGGWGCECEGELEGEGRGVRCGG